MFRVGEIEVHRIVEMEEPFLPPDEVFVGMEADDVRRAAAGLPAGRLCPTTGRLIFSFHAYVLRTPRQTILVDSCVGCGKSDDWYPPWQNRQDETWLHRLKGAGFRPDEIDVVFCTHLHVDHCGWNTRLENGRWVPTFRNARYLFARSEYEASQRHGSSVFEENVLPVMEAGQATLVDTDHELDRGISLTPLIGHTRGHCGVNIVSNGERALLCGDAIHSELQCAYPRLMTVFDSKPEQAADTRLEMLGNCSETGAALLTAHFPSPSLGRVVATDKAFEFKFLE